MTERSDRSRGESPSANLDEASEAYRAVWESEDSWDPEPAAAPAASPAAPAGPPAAPAAAPAAPAAAPAAPAAASSQPAMSSASAAVAAEPLHRPSAKKTLLGIP